MYRIDYDPPVSRPHCFKFATLKFATEEALKMVEKHKCTATISEEIKAFKLVVEECAVQSTQAAGE